MHNQEERTLGPDHLRNGFTNWEKFSLGKRMDAYRCWEHSLLSSSLLPPTTSYRNTYSPGPKNCQSQRWSLHNSTRAALTRSGYNSPDQQDTNFASVGLIQELVQNIFSKPYPRFIDSETLGSIICSSSPESFSNNRAQGLRASILKRQTSVGIPVLSHPFYTDLGNLFNFISPASLISNMEMIIGFIL